MAEEKISEVTADPKQPDWASIPSSYVNAASLVVTNWDFRLLLGEVGPATLGTAVILPRANIVMSPHHMKAYLGILNKHMADYEKEHGEIKWEKPAPAK